VAKATDSQKAGYSYDTASEGCVVNTMYVQYREVLAVPVAPEA